MSVLNHLAQAAAVLLLVELLVVLIIFLGIAGGLAFGLHWVLGKTEWAFGKVNSFLPLVTRYTAIGTEYAAKPLIRVGGAASTIGATARAIERQIRQARLPRPPGTVAARPVTPAPEPEPATVEPVSLV